MTFFFFYYLLRIWMEGVSGEIPIESLVGVSPVSVASSKGGSPTATVAVVLVKDVPNDNCFE